VITTKIVHVHLASAHAVALRDACKNLGVSQSQFLREAIMFYSRAHARDAFKQLYEAAYGPIAPVESEG
jgi:hypothetical protein